MENKQTTIKISVETRKRLMKVDQYISKKYPTHEDRVIWLLDNVDYFRKNISN